MCLKFDCPWGPSGCKYGCLHRTGLEMDCTSTCCFSLSVQEVCSATIFAFHTRTFRRSLIRRSESATPAISAHCRGHAVCNLVLPDVYDYRILWRDANFWFQWTQKHLNKTGRSIADRLPLQPRNSDIQQSLSIDRQWPVRYSRQTPRRLTHSQPLSRFCYLNQLDVTVCRTLR